jgi:NADH:ubiquinone oxidoreductase subunit 6 (subunit J)
VAVSPIYATLFMILAFISVSLGLITLNITYLGLIFLMVYVGAIAILFLFVVMMLPLRHFEAESSLYLTVGVLIFIFFFGILFYETDLDWSFNIYELRRSVDKFNSSGLYYLGGNDYGFTNNYHYSVSTFGDIGALIFTTYQSDLYLCGMCLLVALMGAIYMTNEQDGRRFNMFFRRTQVNPLDRNSQLNRAFYQLDV